jgi:hypothetical protein
MTVNEGEAFVEGTDAETAKKLLEAAEKAGLDPSVVRYAAGDGGFVVPEELAEKPKPKAKAETKTDSKPANDEKK